MTTFTDFCGEWKVTPEERLKLARHLATLRAEATLKLAQPPAICPACGGSWWKGDPPKCMRCGAPCSQTCETLECSRPCYVPASAKLGMHWLESAMERVAAGEPEAEVLEDFGYLKSTSGVTVRAGQVNPPALPDEGKTAP